MFHISYVHVRNWNELSEAPFRTIFYSRKSRFWGATQGPWRTKSILDMRNASSNEHRKFGSNYVGELRRCGTSVFFFSMSNYVTRGRGPFSIIYSPLHFRCARLFQVLLASRCLFIALSQCICGPPQAPF